MSDRSRPLRALRSRPRRRPGRAARAAVPLALLLLACTRETAGGERYVSRFAHGGSHGHGASHGDSSADAHHASPGPRERHWVPESQADTSLSPGAEMEMFEVTAHPDGVPTPEQQRAADRLLERSMLAARKRGWFDFERARADGFEPVHLDTLHHGNRAFYLDDRILDPERPENLLFVDTSRGKRLVGFMFMARTPEERGPQIGGPLTVWHYHRWSSIECAVAGVFPVAFADADGRCPEGLPTLRSPEMMHVWLVDHPEGPFATRMEVEGELMARLLEERALWAAQKGWGRF